MSTKINSSNYEAFVLDYMEGNLSAQDISLLKAFVLSHPELEIDLDDTELVSLEIDEVLYNGKENLKKTTTYINDEQFVAYLENELNTAEKMEFEKALAANSFLQKELSIYKHTVLIPDASIVFSDKASLKRKPKVLWFQSASTLSMAAALVLIFGLWFIFRNNVSTTDINKTENNLSANKNNVIKTTDPTKETAPLTHTVDIVKEEPKQFASNTKATFTSKNKIEKAVTTNTVESVITNNTPNPVANTIPEIKKPEINIEKNKTIIPEKKQEEQPVFASNSKPHYIISEGSDEDELVNPEPSRKIGLLARAGKALRGLNKLGVKQVNAVEQIKKDKEEYVLSLGNFSIKQNKYTQN